MKTTELVALARKRGWSLQPGGNGAIRVSAGAEVGRDPQLLEALRARKREIAALLRAEATMVELAHRLRAVGFEIDRVTAVRELTADSTVRGSGDK